MRTITYKVIEIGYDRSRRENQRVVLYQGPSVNRALIANRSPRSLPFGEKRFYVGTQRRYAYDLPNPNPEEDGYGELMEPPKRLPTTTMTTEPLTPLELKAVAFCLRWLQWEVRKWDLDEMPMIPPFTPQEMVELKGRVFAKEIASGEQPQVSLEEGYLEDLRLTTLFLYLLECIGTPMPEIE